MKFSWFILFISILELFQSWAEEDIQPDQLTAEQTEFFEAKVRPILAEHCYDCHSNQAKKLKGKLFLDSKWGWATGGVGGPAIIPGDLVESMVIDAVKHTEELVDAMPPKYKIEDEEIAILEKWVLMGAPDPRPKVEPKDGLVEKFDSKKDFRNTGAGDPLKICPHPKQSRKIGALPPLINLFYPRSKHRAYSLLNPPMTEPGSAGFILTSSDCHPPPLKLLKPCKFPVPHWWTNCLLPPLWRKMG